MYAFCAPIQVQLQLFVCSFGMSAQRKVVPIRDLLLIAFFDANDVFCWWSDCIPYIIRMEYIPRALRPSPHPLRCCKSIRNYDRHDNSDENRDIDNDTTYESDPLRLHRTEDKLSLRDRRYCLVTIDRIDEHHGRHDAEHRENCP
jgi:hypothetical protein